MEAEHVIIHMLRSLFAPVPGGKRTQHLYYPAEPMPIPCLLGQGVFYILVLAHINVRNTGLFFLHCQTTLGDHSCRSCARAFQNPDLEKGSEQWGPSPAGEC